MNEPIVRLRLVTTNARLADARKAKGLTQNQIPGFSFMKISHLENLRRVPTEEDMVKLSILFEQPADYLFPQEVLDAVRAGAFARRKRELAAPEVLRLAEVSQQFLLSTGEINEVEDVVDNQLLKDKIEELLPKLKGKKEQEVIKWRFGLDDGRSRTLAEIGSFMNLTPQYISQIEASALRQLRRWHREELKDFLD